jgi:hypothetical protein
MASKTPFRPLSETEFRKLSLDERMKYLHRAMADIREKLQATRHQALSLKRKTGEADDS